MKMPYRRSILSSEKPTELMMDSVAMITAASTHFANGTDCKSWLFRFRDVELDLLKLVILVAAICGAASACGRSPRAGLRRAQQLAVFEPLREGFEKRAPDSLPGSLARTS
jgi:hypothetical protein